MQATIQKWGNSQGVRIPKKILDDLMFKENEPIEIKELNGNILITKVRETRRHIPLAERLKNWNDKPYEPSNEDREWMDMKPAGEEIW